MEPSYEGNLTESEDCIVFHDDYVLIDVSQEDLACFPEYESTDNLTPNLQSIIQIPSTTSTENHSPTPIHVSDSQSISPDSTVYPNSPAGQPTNPVDLSLTHNCKLLFMFKNICHRK